MSDDGHGAGDGMATGVATALVELRQIGISFERAAGDPLVIMDGFDLSVSAGSLTCIAGRSGSGKTSVLRVAAGLATPTSGVVAWAGTELPSLGGDEMADLRRNTVGISDQRADLIDELSAIENVLLPAVPARRTRALLPRAKELLAGLGLASRAHSVIPRKAVRL